MTLSMEPWNWRLESPVNLCAIWIWAKKSWPLSLISKIHPGFTEKRVENMFINTCDEKPIMLIFSLDSHEPEHPRESMIFALLVAFARSGFKFIYTIYCIKGCIRCWLNRSDTVGGVPFRCFFRTFLPRNMGTIQFVDFKRVGSTTN